MNSIFVFVIAVMVGTGPVKMIPHPIPGDRAHCEEVVREAVTDKDDYNEALELARKDVGNQDAQFKLFCVPLKDFMEAGKKIKNPQDLGPAKDILIDTNEVKITEKESKLKTPVDPDYTKDWRLN